MYSLKAFCAVLIFLTFSSCQPNTSTDKETEMEKPTSTSSNFDWQGHRGARGLVAENTIPAFLKALSYPIQTLELDVVVTKDSLVLVSHEPWMSAEICNQPNGYAIYPAEQEGFKILEMDYETVKTYNCGLKHSRFTEQDPIEVYKPLLSEMIDAVEAYCQENDRDLPNYNIEIKSRPAWDNVFTPEPKVFAALVLDVVKEKGIFDRTCIQSFDVRSVEAVHELDPNITQAYLVETPGNVEQKLSLLSFQPEIYSPYYPLLNKSILDTLHQKGMKVIPWTVNETAEMKKLVDMGVDGIITDYPDRIPFNK
ncbi:MAG: glycerophosphodiester phosphodiesterase family protein [Bacteroidota bacterium]